eukprot:12055-Heterococcus_DN1.PRE.3
MRRCDDAAALCLLHARMLRKCDIDGERTRARVTATRASFSWAGNQRLPFGHLLKFGSPNRLQTSLRYSALITALLKSSCGSISSTTS